MSFITENTIQPVFCYGLTVLGVQMSNIVWLVVQTGVKETFIKYMLGKHKTADHPWNKTGGSLRFAAYLIFMLRGRPCLKEVKWRLIEWDIRYPPVYMHS